MKKTALDHIKEQTGNSRTILFNAIMSAITTYLLAISTIAEGSYPVIDGLLAPTLVFVSSVGNIILYGMTKVKDNA